MALPPFLRSASRTVMDLRSCGIPSVPDFGRYNYSRAKQGLESHRHRGAMEICYLVRGRQTYYVGGRRFCLRGGDVFLTLPDEMHSTGGEPEEKGLLYWMALKHPDKTHGALAGLDRRDSRCLWKELNSDGKRHFPGSPNLKHHLDAITELFHAPHKPLKAAIMTHKIQAFLFDLLDARNRSEDAEGNHIFEAVIRHIKSHLDQPEALKVEDLAGLAGLSVSRFKGRFKEELGIPPAEYALRLRVEEAARRLRRSGVSVTDVAMQMGFSSSQYFASVYRRFTNTTPREAKN